MRYLIYVLPLSILFTISCKKKDPAYPTVPVGAAIYALPNVPGAYWVFETFITDSLGVTTSSGTIDTLYLVGESILNGNTYNAYYRSSNPSNVFYERDSSHYIVDQNGLIKYAYVNFGEIISEITQTAMGPLGTSVTWNTKSYTMNDLQNSFTVPAGSFNTINHRSHTVDTSGLAINVCGDLFFDSDFRYAKGIGLIYSKSAYFSQIVNECKYFEEVLIDYYIP